MSSAKTISKAFSLALTSSISFTAAPCGWCVSQSYMEGC